MIYKCEESMDKRSRRDIEVMKLKILIMFCTMLYVLVLTIPFFSMMNSANDNVVPGQGFLSKTEKLPQVQSFK